MMNRPFITNDKGAAAVEFALVLPVALIFLCGMIMAAIGLWYSSLLKDVAFESSRCLAIGGPSCTEPAPGCTQEPKICFVIALARDRGLPDLAPETITINSNDMSSDVVSTSVTVAYPYNILGYSLKLNESASFPNF